MTAHRIKRLRRRLRWTQKKLAAQLGVTARTIQNWEAHGCRKNAPAEKVLETLE